MLNMAFMVSRSSNDPNTSVGCAIFSADGKLIVAKPNVVVVEDYNKWTKNHYAIHAEMNALLNRGYSLMNDATMYVYMSHGRVAVPCAECAKHIIGVGCRHVVVSGGEYHPTWVDSQQRSMEMFKKAGVTLEIVEQ